MKAQTEIMGLLFVIILAIFGFMLYISLNNNVEVINTYQDKQLALSMLSAMIHTDVIDDSYEELVVKCVRTNVCEDLVSVSKTMLGELDTLNVPYEFTITKSGGTVINSEFPIKSNPECGTERNAVATQPIAIDISGNHAMIKLDICN